MSEQILTALGGVGLFLLGMAVMTSGLRKLAGERLHGMLAHFTRSPGSGALTGTLVTAVLQSSSATTVATVGFVAAGLLSFPQALGVILGANVGTTVTGWLVALFGFKLNLGLAALPMVFIGALANLLGHGHWKNLGRVLAGFATLLLGIEYLQEGMADFASVITPQQFPSDSISGHLLLVLMGASLVLVIQSSSAGVAIAMSALSAGAIDFGQAACLVIGMDVGTTVTAVIASIGVTRAARRTGFSHTVYNLFSAALALLMLEPYISLLNIFAPDALVADPELSLVGFHTAFNVLGLLLGLPLADRFARLMTWLVPEHEHGLAARLDSRLLAEPLAAEAALRATLRDEFRYLLAWLGQELEGRGRPHGHHLLSSEFAKTQEFMDSLNAVPASAHPQLPLMSAIHMLDHLRRLAARVEQQGRIADVLVEPGLQRSAAELGQAVRELLADLDSDRNGLGSGDAIERVAASLASAAGAERDLAIRHAVELDWSVEKTARAMDARRWLERVADHVWRAALHFGGTASATILAGD